MVQIYWFLITIWGKIKVMHIFLCIGPKQLFGKVSMQVHLLVVDPLAIDEVLVLARRVVLVVNLVVSSDIFSSTIFSSNFGSRVQLFTLRLRTATCESPPPPSGTQPPVLSSLIITWVTTITTTIATTSLSSPPSIDHRHHNAITATKNMSTNIGSTMDRDT